MDLIGSKKEEDMTSSMALRSYHKTKVQTADTLGLIIMCYDAAIRDLEEAKRLHDLQAMEETYSRIRHAQDLITELLVGLDYERGGEIAINLSRVYNFILRQLIGINSRQDTKIYNHLIRILDELRDAWQQIRGQPGISMAALPQSARVAV
jgi:flagellar secretion chaperone FliS